jgi:hypothetical protein
MHIYYEDVRVEFFVKFFDNLKYNFLVWRAYAPVSRIEFGVDRLDCFQRPVDRMCQMINEWNFNKPLNGG